MDLTLQDVAELLNVSESTIERWIADSKIPYYRLKHQYRFSRSEVENWVLSWKQGNFFEPKTVERLGTQQFGLFRSVNKGGVWADVPGKNKEEVVRAAMKRIAGELNLDAEVLTDLLLDRERLMPTGLGYGIAVPHTRDFLLQEAFDVVAIVFPKKPIEYGSLDGQPVHTLFFLFACDDKRHLNLLAKIAYFCGKKENLELLKKKPTRVDLLESIKAWESNLRVPAPELSKVSGR